MWERCGSESSLHPKIQGGGCAPCAPADFFGITFDPSNHQTSGPSRLGSGAVHTSPFRERVGPNAPRTIAYALNRRLGVPRGIMSFPGMERGAVGFEPGDLMLAIATRDPVCI